MMLESGCVGLFFGIETFNKESGRIVGKGLGERAKDILAEIRRRDGRELFIHGSFISGLPSEHPSKQADELLEWYRGGCDIDTILLIPLSLTPAMIPEWNDVGYEMVYRKTCTWANRRDGFDQHDAFCAAQKLMNTIEYDIESYMIHTFRVLQMMDGGISLQELKNLRSMIKRKESNTNVVYLDMWNRFKENTRQKFKDYAFNLIGDHVA